jgi:hypothetical protein
MYQKAKHIVNNTIRKIVNDFVNNCKRILGLMKYNTDKFVLLILKLNKHEKNYFNSSSSIRFIVC